MNKTFRIILLLVGLLAASGAVSLPWWFGLEAEKSYDAMLDLLTRHGKTVIASKKYERGWLGSTAESVIRIPEAKVEIIASHHIHHGPFPFSRLRDGHWQPAQAHITSQFTLHGPDKSVTVPPVNADLVLRLDGDGNLRAEMPAVRKTGDRGQLIDWRGLALNLTFDREWKQFRLEAQMPGLNLTTAEKEEVALSQITLKSDMREGTAGYLFGDATLAVRELGLRNATGNMSLQGLEVSTSAKPAGENVNLAVRYQLEEARADAERFGPGELVLELRHLDAATLVKFKTEVDAIQRGNLPPPQAAMMMAGKGLQLVGALAKKAPELEITRLRFKTREGEIRGKAKFVLDGRNQDLGQNPLLLLTAVAGDVELSLPPGVVKQMLAPQIRRDIEAYRGNALSEQEVNRIDPDTLAQIVDRAWPQYLTRNEFTRHLIEDHGQYRLTFSLRQGQMQLNGKPWQFPPRTPRHL